MTTSKGRKARHTGFDPSLWTPEMQALHERALPLQAELETLDNAAMIAMDYRAFRTVLFVRMFLGIGRCPATSSAAVLRECQRSRHKLSGAITWISENLDYLRGRPTRIEVTVRKVADA